MALKPNPTDLALGWDSPSKEAENRLPLDTLLRKHGFRIHSRAKGREAVWEKGDVLYTFTEAVQTLPRKEVEAVEGGPIKLRGGLGKW